MLFIFGLTTSRVTDQLSLQVSTGEILGLSKREYLDTNVGANEAGLQDFWWGLALRPYKPSYNLTHRAMHQNLTKCSYWDYDGGGFEGL